MLSGYDLGRLRLEAHLSPPLVATATSDSKGRFTLEIPDSGIWSVRVQSESTLPMEFAPLAVAGDVLLPPVVLEPIRKLSVRVASPDGTAVPKAAVVAAPTRDPPDNLAGWRPTFRVEFTNQRGSATLPRRVGETVDLSVFVPGRAERVLRDFNGGTVVLARRARAL